MHFPKHLAGKGLAALIMGLVLMAHFPAHAAIVDVSIPGLSFSPASITVPVGTTVRWTNNHSINHTSTADGGLWDSGLLAPGQSFSFTFNTAGTYPYHCTVHLAMLGTVIVTPGPFSKAPALSPLGAGLLILLLIGTTIWILRRRRTAGVR